MTKKISLLHQNITGAIGKAERINIALLELLEKDEIDIDVICLTETFMKKGNESLLKIPNFKLASYYSRNCSRGGSCILIKNRLQFKEIPIIKQLATNIAFEVCGIEILHLNLIIVCIYRVPEYDATVFLELFETLLQKLSAKFKNKKVIISGDWNIDLLKKGKKQEILSTILKNYNYDHVIKVPTRRSSCLGQFATNIKRYINSGIHHLTLSDHETAQRVTIELKANMPYAYTEWTEDKRDYSKDNMNKFCECMAALKFTELYEQNTLNETFDIFHNLILLFFNLCFPIIRRKVKLNKVNKCRWISKGIKKSCLQKRIYYLKYIHSKENKKLNSKTYKAYNKMLQKCIKKSQQIQNIKYINSQKNKNKAVWEVIRDNICNNYTQTNEINCLKVNNTSINDPNVICIIK